MEVESVPSRHYDRRPSSRWEWVERSNCRMAFFSVVGLVAFGVFLALEYGSEWASTTILAGLWPWLVGSSAVVWVLCALILAWHLYQLKIAHREKMARARLLEESYSQSRQTTLLLKEARANGDNVKITYGDDEKVKSLEVIRASVLLEQSRIQQGARGHPAAGSSRTVSQQPQPLPPQEQKAQLGPVVPKKLVRVPPAYDLIEALRRFPLAEETLFLGVDGDKQVLRCNPKRELCHGAFNAVTGRGKTFLARGMETQLLKVGYEVVHADIKFTLIDEFGNDYRPIARALLNQGEMHVGGLTLPHLLLREDHIVYFLEWLAGPELQRRLSLYNQGKHTYKTFFLFLEELLYLIGKYKHLGPVISPLLSVGRSLGIKMFCAAQNFQVQNLKINSGMRENFESAWFLGGDLNSGAALLDLSPKALSQLLVENHIQLGKGVNVFRNNAVAYDARVMRGGLASDDFVYWLLGKADGFVLPDEILPGGDVVGSSPPGGLWVPAGSGEAANETGQERGELPVDEDVREALEAYCQGARGPRALERALGCTYYRALQLWAQLKEKGFVVPTDCATRCNL
jgi:hypothetical protein